MALRQKLAVENDNIICGRCFNGTDSNNLIDDTVYREVLSFGMPDTKRKEYLLRDSAKELKPDLNQYCRMHLDGVTSGGVKIINVVFNSNKKCWAVKLYIHQYIILNHYTIISSYNY